MSRVRDQKLRSKLKHASKIKESVMKKAYDYFKKLTPRKTGNAQRRTKLVKDVIEANYAYAPVLDKGRHNTSSGARGSKQAPQGMSKPTVKLFRSWVQRYIRLGK